jgi:hypothetical protein
METSLILRLCNADIYHMQIGFMWPLPMDTKLFRWSQESELSYSGMWRKTDTVTTETMPSYETTRRHIPECRKFDSAVRSSNFTQGNVLGSTMLYNIRVGATMKSFLRSWQLFIYARTCKNFMKCEDQLPCSQTPSALVPILSQMKPVHILR